MTNNEMNKTTPMSYTIAVVQVKGGAGRSTLATNLAGELAKEGRTALIDCDMPQGSSASWAAVRQDRRAAGDLVADTASSYQEMVAKVERYRSADYIVLDGPPRIAEMTRAALILADLTLIPVGASKAEIWATGDVLALIEEATAIKKVLARMVWTRFRPHTLLAKELSDLATKELGLQAMATSLGLRVAYPEALGEGLTVVESGDPSSRAEVQSLVAEVKSMLRRS